MLENFEYLMLSAGFENGGNITQRYLDNHEELWVYPFESQLGNRHVNNYLSSLERTQYRYPEFPANISDAEAYELFYDEELKTLLRKPNGSKFSKRADLQMKESDRIASFCKHLEGKERKRGNYIEAFFRSTFDSWKNYKTSGKNHIYVGYSPIIGIDADRILADFPSAHILHVVRNPFSAYSDTKKRPFPLTLRQYTISWNIYHHVLLMLQKKYNNITILRYEDLISDPEKALTPICQKLGLKFTESMTYPSWNGMDLRGNAYPWGTINDPTPEQNKEVAASLSNEEIDDIQKYSSLLLDQFDYNGFGALKLGTTA